uniref:stomatin-like n=1 Tax=Styela clava TaxID=7725 RepID=UPI00193AD590|nr:stomatin-like [Styela clava]
MSQHQIEVEEDYEEESAVTQICLNVFCVLFIILTFPLTIWGVIKIVNEYERAVAFRLGRLVRGPAKGPGVMFLLPCVDEVKIVDMRVKSFDVPPQEILTRDGVTVSVDAVVFYKVFNATWQVTKVEDADAATMLSGQTTLRNILGTKTMSEILSEKDQIAHEMQELIDTATDEWGIKVQKVEVKDVRLPVQLQRAMASEAEAGREAKAKVISAEGETKASRLLKEAANIMSDSPDAIKLRYLQTLNSISADRNETVIVPFQEEVVRALLQKFFA